MRLSTRKVLLLLLALAAGIVFLLTNYLGSRRRELDYDVRVINGFTSNSSLALVIWCSSAGDQNSGDMGGRALQEGDDFSWISRMTTTATSRWLWDFNGNDSKANVLCTVKWDEKRKKFEAFKVARDVRRCGIVRKCSWLVKEDGFYFSSDEVNWKKDFSWS